MTDDPPAVAVATTSRAGHPRGCATRLEGSAAAGGRGEGLGAGELEVGLARVEVVDAGGLLLLRGLTGVGRSLDHGFPSGLWGPLEPQRYRPRFV